MYQLARAPRGIGQVLDSMFQLTRAMFVPMLPLSFLGGLISSIPLAYMLLSGAVEDPAVAATTMASVGYWISFAVMLPLSVLLYAACLLLGESIAQGNRFGIGKCIALVVPRLLTVILASICFALAIALGLVLLVVPGLLLMVSLYMYLPAIVLDGKGSIESLKYSHNLVWGNWWRTAAIASIAVIIIYVMIILIGIILALVFLFTGFNPVIAFLVEAGTTLFGSLLITPFFIALYLEIYRDLKMRKTGGDLAARIESAGAPA